MPKRSISDVEIGVIKAMLLKGMMNRDIQVYFNRQDRPVNSGRITQIRLGSYGPNVEVASEGELNAFLAKFPSTLVGVTVQRGSIDHEPSVEQRAASLFEDRGSNGWFLKRHETDGYECKETFCLKPEYRFADALRSIAGLANKDGGFVFFGVSELQDRSLIATGLKDHSFLQTDPSEVNRCLAGTLDPVPSFGMFTLTLGDKIVGCIHVEKHPYPPVVAVKNISSDVKEGAIYYRYVGETRTIRPGELRQIISYREHKAVSEFAQKVGRVAAGTAATIDLDTGAVEGTGGRFVIDEELLPKLQFVRHGEFRQEHGAPTLRLVGDVTAFGPNAPRTVRKNVTDEAVLIAFLNHDAVDDPLPYILHSAYSARRWLPLLYYAVATRKPFTEVAAILRKETAANYARQEGAAQRLGGARNGAFQAASGRGRATLIAMLRGEQAAPSALPDVSPFALAIQALPSNADVDFEWLRGALLKSYELTRGNAPQQKAIRGYVYRAACRIDELECAVAGP